jgi:hypothetical protein
MKLVVYSSRTRGFDGRIFVVWTVNNTMLVGLASANRAPYGACRCGWGLRIFKTWWLFNIDFFGDWAIQESTLDIHLM